MFSSELKIHPALYQKVAISAICRIASGISVVRRRANPNREFSLTFKHLGKLNPVRSSHLQELVDCWRCVIGDETHNVSPLIIGLAESGIVPAFAMYRACEELSIGASWCHSSREVMGEIAFMESHSHAPRHFLSAKELHQDRFSELWIVDDEITTGATLVNLIESLFHVRMFRSVRIFTLLDNRASSLDSIFASLAHRVGVSIDVTSLISFFGNPSLFPIMNDVEEIERGPIEYVWGELISESLPALFLNPQKCIQQVTLSRWMVDGLAVRRHTQIGELYSIYNARDEESVLSLLDHASCSP
jgi:hypothetical protein